jgi:hypothetical protein
MARWCARRGIAFAAIAIATTSCAFELADVARGRDAGAGQDASRADASTGTDADRRDSATPRDATDDDGDGGPPRPPRVTAGLVALYDFDEGSGTIVRDKSGVPPALDLSGSAPAMRWVAGGLQLTAATQVSSSGNAQKIIAACQATSEVTFEAWVTPSAAPQGQVGFAARIMQIGNDNNSFNLLVGPIGADYRFNIYSASGQAVPTTTGSLATASLTHLVATRTAGGSATLHVTTSASSTAVNASQGGGLGGWNGWPLTLGSTQTGDQPWLGTYHLVAFYARALTAAEVAQNFAAGP